MNCEALFGIFNKDQINHQNHPCVRFIVVCQKWIIFDGARGIETREICSLIPKNTTFENLFSCSRNVFTNVLFSQIKNVKYPLFSETPGRATASDICRVLIIAGKIPKFGSLPSPNLIYIYTIILYSLA